MKKYNVPGEKAAAQAKTERLKAFLTAFKGAPINTTDWTPEHYNPYKNVRRLWPNSEVWKHYSGKYPPRIVVTPGVKFCHRPQIQSRTLSSSRGRVLQWIALNPTMTISELAKAMGRSEPAVRNDVQKLREAGVLYQTKVWAIHPLLIGEGRLFNETARPLPLPDEIDEAKDD